MPGRDRTGPQSQGPMTGRGLGYCAGNDEPGYGYPGGRRFVGRGGGRGFGMGPGRGFGRGFGPDRVERGATGERSDETAIVSVRDEIAHLKEMIENLLGRIEATEKNRKDEPFDH